VADRAARSPVRFLTLLSLVCLIHAPAPALAQLRKPELPALLPAEIAGSSTLILDEAAARALRLVLEGTGEARGAGRGTVPYRTVATPIRFTTYGFRLPASGSSLSTSPASDRSWAARSTASWATTSSGDS
jgi:hypothetical protein